MSADKKFDLHSLFGTTAPEASPEIGDREWVEGQLEPVAGDRIVCTLEEPMINRFVALNMAEINHDEMQQMIVDRIAAIRTEAASDRPTMAEYHKRLEAASVFASRAEAEEAFKIFHLYEVQLAMFWYDLRAHLNLWGDVLSVRHGWQVVSVGQKYKL